MEKVFFVPFLTGVRGTFGELTGGVELFTFWDDYVAPEGAETACLSRTHIAHAASITLARVARRVADVFDIAAKQNLLDGGVLARAIKVLIEKIVYPDGRGPLAGDEWVRNAALRNGAAEYGYALLLELKNASLREEYNTPEKRAERAGCSFAYAVACDDPATGQKAAPQDALHWGSLMSFVSLQTLVHAGLRHLSDERVPWALMALVRYVADGNDYRKNIDRLRELVELCIMIEGKYA